jgi:signal transduction histidine kinase
MESVASLRGPAWPAFMRSPLTLVLAPVLTSGAAVSVLAAVKLPGSSWSALLAAAVLLLSATVAEAFPVPIYGVKAGSTSLATIAIVATGALYSWPLAAVVGLLTMFLVEVRRRKPLVQVACNSAFYGIAGAASGLVSAASPSATGLTGALAFYSVNIGLLATVIARVTNVRYLQVLRSFVSSTFTPFVVMATTTAILVQLWQRSPLLGLLLLPPLVAIAGYQRSLHAATERQRELDRLKEEFVAVVSHELRTPLTAIYGGIETMERHALSDDVRARLFAVIRQEASRLARLVDDVLWANRLDAPKGAATAPFDAAVLVGAAAAAAAETAPANVRVLALPDQQLPSVLGDREQAQRVLANLLENAIKYSPDGGTIEASVRVRDGRVRFTVRDEGIGIPESQREQIFEKFVRLDPQMTRGVGGTGLGLFICRQLVEQMHGRIWAEDNKPRGTAFAFELPAALPSGKKGRQPTQV